MFVLGVVFLNMIGMMFGMILGMFVIGILNVGVLVNYEVIKRVYELVMCLGFY